MIKATIKNIPACAFPSDWYIVARRYIDEQDIYFYDCVASYKQARQEAETLYNNSGKNIETYIFRTMEVYRTK